MSDERPGSKPLRREIELDFIRGLAVLLVVDNHTVRLLAGMHLPFDTGQLGVSIFFVLSGFLVGGILMREWDAFGTIDARRFLARRGLKIWPQYYVFLVAMLITAHRDVAQLWGNFLNVQNYTGGIAHTWSLAVEEHAYLLLTFLMVVAARFTLQKVTVLRLLFGVVAVVSLVRIACIRHGIDVFSGTQFRIDGIVWGLILAMVFQFFLPRFLQLQRLRVLWGGCLLLHPLGLLLSPHWPGLSGFVYDVNNLFGIAVLLLLYRPQAQTLRPARRLPYRLVAWIGLYSYGIYLWHVSVVRPTFFLVEQTHLAVPPVLIKILAALLGIAVGVTVTELVELPMLRVRDRLFPRKLSAALEVGVEEVPREV